MSFNYQNPLAGTIYEAPVGVALDNSTGTNFSVYNIGGYMEVYSYADLNYVIPPGTEGTVLYSGNTIPISFAYNAPFSIPNVLTFFFLMISHQYIKLIRWVY